MKQSGNAGMSPKGCDTASHIPGQRRLIMDAVWHDALGRPVVRFLGTVYS
jgi:hypothetical protein